MKNKYNTIRKNQSPKAVLGLAFATLSLVIRGQKMTAKPSRTGYFSIFNPLNLIINPLY